MLTLYHFDGAICAQKVRIALTEKKLEWESRECVGSGLRDPDYLRLNPNGVVPTLVHNEFVLTESRIISEYVNDAFEGPPLMPSDAQGRYLARLWSKRIDDSLHLHAFVLTFVSGMRDAFIAMSVEDRNAAMPGLRDPIKRQISRELLAGDLEAPWVKRAIEAFHDLIGDMELALSKAPHLSGQQYSLADADYTAYVRRLSDLGFELLWADKPAVADWWRRMSQRPSYKKGILDWVRQRDVERYHLSRQRLAPLLRTLKSGSARS